jgi:hypothetical protein
MLPVPPTLSRYGYGSDDEPLFEATYTVKGMAKPATQRSRAFTRSWSASIIGPLLVPLPNALGPAPPLQCAMPGTKKMR